VFCAIVQAGSFTRTAAHLGVSPAFVTKRVAILEGQLGVKLFHRNTRRVVLSQDGETVHASALKMIEHMAALSDTLASNRNEPSGVLRVAASPCIGRARIAPILKLFNQRHPQVEIWLELADREVDLVAEGFDLDIRVGAPPQQELIGHRLATGGRVLCAAPSYLARYGEPSSLAELARHDCLVARYREQGLGLWRLHGPDGAQIVKVPGRFGSNQGEVILDWAVQGMGIALLSEWDIADQVDSGKLVRLLPAYHEPADLWVMTGTRGAGSAKISACLAFLREHMATGPLSLQSSY
jgi:LysR family transcriptional activator of dmlA